jgi:hypothetical protein
MVPFEVSVSGGLKGPVVYIVRRRFGDQARINDGSLACFV